MTSLSSFVAPAARASVIAEGLDTLSRRGEKLGLAPVVYSISEARTVTERVMCPWENIDKTVVKTVVDVTVEDRSCHIDGFELMAQITHTSEGNLVSPLGEEDVDVKWCSAPASCDHCGHDRRRLSTYLIRQVDTGKLVQVGSTCLNVFMGHASALSIALHLADVRVQVAGFIEDEPMGYGRGGASDLALWLGVTVDVIREHGFLSRGKSREQGGIPTSDRVLEIMLDHKHPTATQEAWDKAQAIIEWAAALDASSTYEGSLKTIAKLGFVDSKTQGFASSMPSAYDRATAPTPVGLPSEYVGKVKERREFTATLTGVTSFEGYYGVTWVFTFTEACGNVIVWLGSSNPDVGGVALSDRRGEVLTFKGTIKAHDVFRGVKQTKVQRCSF